MLRAAPGAVLGAVLLISCGGDYQPECASLRLEPEAGNHVQPYQIAVDSQRRRVLSTALATRNVALIDADTEELIDLYRIHTSPLTNPDIAVSTLGTAWVVAGASPGLIRLDLEDGTRLPLSEVFEVGRAILSLPDGRMAALGGTDDAQRIVTLDDDGAVLDSLSLPERGTALLTLDDGASIGLLSSTAELVVLSAEDLSEQDRCPLPFAASAAAQLDDGTVIVASAQMIGVAGCDGEPVAWSAGVENKDVIAMGDHAMVLDRIGSGDIEPNTGVARMVDADGVFAEHPTAKNTGFGALDEALGRVWVNSEGTTELWAIGSDGEVSAAVRTGSFLDGLTLDPKHPGVAYVSGRLSDTFARLDSGEVTAQTGAVRWPYSPIVDLHRDLVWTTSQLDAILYGLDRDDLSVRYAWDMGHDPNVLLTFSALAYHPGRNTLFFAESQADVLHEVDPDSGAIRGTWDLGGPPITDRDEIGELSIRISGVDDQVFIVRSNDVRVQRLDPDSGTLTTARHDALADTLVQKNNRVDGVRIFPDRRRMYIGGYAIDLDTLSRTTTEDRAVSRILGIHPDHPDRWIAVSKDQRYLIELTEDGRERGRLSFTGRDLNASLFRISADRREVEMIRSNDAFFCMFDVREIR